VPQLGDESVALAAAGADRDFHTLIIGRGPARAGGAPASPTAGVSGALRIVPQDPLAPLGTTPRPRLLSSRTVLDRRARAG
jgi:hypothetical protein